METDQKDNFCGVHKEFYEDGKLKSEIFKMNGKEEGIFKEFHRNGFLKSEVNYIDDKQIGVYKLYHTNG